MRSRQSSVEQIRQFIDVFFRDQCLTVKVKSLERHGRGNARHLQVGADASLEALVAFACEQVIDDLDGCAVLLVSSSRTVSKAERAASREGHTDVPATVHNFRRH